MVKNLDTGSSEVLINVDRFEIPRFSLDFYIISRFSFSHLDQLGAQLFVWSCCWMSLVVKFYQLYVILWHLLLCHLATLVCCFVRINPCRLATVVSYYVRSNQCLLDTMVSCFVRCTPYQLATVARCHGSTSDVTWYHSSKSTRNTSDVTTYHSSKMTRGYVWRNIIPQ